MKMRKIYIYLNNYIVKIFMILTFSQPRIFLMNPLPKRSTCTPRLFTLFCLQREEYLAKSDFLYFVLPNIKFFYPICVIICLNTAFMTDWQSDYELLPHRPPSTFGCYEYAQNMSNSSKNKTGLCLDMKVATSKNTILMFLSCFLAGLANNSTTNTTFLADKPHTKSTMVPTLLFCCSWAHINLPLCFNTFSALTGNSVRRKPYLLAWFCRSFDIPEKLLSFEVLTLL